VTGPVNVVLLRGLIPELPVRVGDVLPARVFSATQLVLAGVRVQAQLPAGLEVGQRLRLQVQEASGQRLALRVVDGAPDAPAQLAQAAQTADPLAGALRAGLAVTLPGGQVARLFVDGDEEGAGAGGRGGALTRVTLRFEAAALGRVDLALDLLPGAVSGTVHAPAGEPAARLAEHADELRAALAQAVGRPASVSVRPRGETVNLRA
jgi:hypothetical protein